MTTLIQASAMGLILIIVGMVVFSRLQRNFVEEL